jgi:hypothetical protein
MWRVEVPALWRGKLNGATADWAFVAARETRALGGVVASRSHDE